MTSNLHSVSFNQFLTDVAKYEQQIKNPRSTAADIVEVAEFIIVNQDWMNFLVENSKENREPVKKLSERLRRIGSAEGKEIAKMIDQSLARDVSLTRKVSLVKDAMKEVLRHTVGDLRDLEMRRALANASQASKGMRQLSDEVRIEVINDNHLKFNELGFKTAEEAINFLIHSPARERLEYVNFDGLPLLSNKQFEVLITHCPNLQHIEIPKSLVYGDSLKYLAKLKNLKSLNIAGCVQLEKDSLKYLANLNKLQSLTMEGCDQLEVKYLSSLINLQSLTLRWCTQLEDADLQCIANLINLKLLNIGHCTRLERNALKRIEKLINLQSLTIEGCIQLKEDALKPLVHLVNLQLLDISGCEQFEDDTLDYLVNLNKLQTIKR